MQMNLMPEAISLGLFAPKGFLLVGKLFFGTCLQVMGVALLVQKATSKAIIGYILLMIGIFIALYMPYEWLLWRAVS